jgi:hypothetical protein
VVRAPNSACYYFSSRCISRSRENFFARKFLACNTYAARHIHQRYHEQKIVSINILSAAQDRMGKKINSPPHFEFPGSKPRNFASILSALCAWTHFEKQLLQLLPNRRLLPHHFSVEENRRRKCAVCAHFGKKEGCHVPKVTVVRATCWLPQLRVCLEGAPQLLGNQMIRVPELGHASIRNPPERPSRWPTPIRSKNRFPNDINTQVLTGNFLNHPFRCGGPPQAGGSSR